MAFPKSELCRQAKGPEVTHADRCTLIFDTASKHLYVEREMAHLEANVGAWSISDYLKQGGQTTGHRELWGSLRTRFF